MSRIFISYRREDSEHIAGRVYDHLEHHFGRDSVFIDVDTVPVGVDFREHLDQGVARCQVLLAIIGEQWLNNRYKEGPRQGQRRLDDPVDFVRLEIQSALRRGILVIPVLVGRAVMPGEQDLPEGLKDLAYRNAATVRAGRDFRDDLDRLIRGIEHLLPDQDRRPGSVPGERAAVPAGSGVQQETDAQIFVKYNERFQKLLEGFPDAFRPETLSRKFSEVPAAEASRLRECLVRYLTLCSEEHFLWRKGHLSGEVWSIWRVEIERLLRTPLYRSAWPELRAEYDPDPGFVEYVERVQKGDPGPS
jgi:hypothetical protein